MISIVIPVYNEQETLLPLFTRLSKAAQAWGEDYEVILVNDGSSDGTSDQLELIHGQDRRWKVLAFSRNFGHQTAISAGIHFSQGDVVAVMDADLQDPPEELHRFISKLREGYQVVYAIRTKRKENLFKRASYKLFYRLLKSVASIDIPLDSGDFCVMDRTVVEVLKAMPERTRFVRGLRCWGGFRQVGIAYERSARYAGSPKYTFFRLVHLALNGILSFSSVPLRLASLAGICLCLLSLVLIVSLVGWALFDVRWFGMQPRDVAGWTSLVSFILLLSGMQLLMLGIIGEYLARVFDEVHARPPWIISHSRGFPAEKQRGEIGWFAQERPSNRTCGAIPDLPSERSEHEANVTGI
jgi:glycosyltransferase involved in cell wall biosynthesis